MIPMRKLARAPSRTGVRYWQLFWQRLDSFHRCNNASLHLPTTLPAYQGPHSPPSSTLASVNLKAFRPYSPNEFGKDSPMPLPPWQPCPASVRGRRGLLLVKLLHRDATVTSCAPDARLPVVFLYPTHSSRADPAVACQVSFSGTSQAAVPFSGGVLHRQPPLKRPGPAHRDLRSLGMGSRNVIFVTHFCTKSSTSGHCLSITGGLLGARPSHRDATALARQAVPC